ncbi:MAG: NAD-dependent epimerase/dehydratase family protein [Bacteroidetes bacterium]|nr:NAD-dependent epimerase/dehydratase family protein [Bacteroidota bacterium]
MILITGASGLVGSHLTLALLQRGQAVRALYRSKDSLEKVRALFALYGQATLFEKAHWVQADITDIPALEPLFENIQEVYHCAALISFDPADEKKLRKINIEGTANIVNLCLDFKIQKLCYLSSIAALGPPVIEGSAINETTDWNPEHNHSDYAISKHGAEMEIWRAQQEGLSVRIINPGVILGPGFWDQGSGIIFDRVHRGLLFYTRGTTGFVGVDDVIQCMIQSMQTENSGDQFIVVTENKSYEWLTKTLAHQLKVNAPKLYAPLWLTVLLARLDGLLSWFGKKRTLSIAMAKSLHSQEAYQNTKAQNQLKIQFEPLEQTLARMCAYYLKKR